LKSTRLSPEQKKQLVQSSSVKSCVCCVKYEFDGLEGNHRLLIFYPKMIPRAANHGNSLLLTMGTVMDRVDK
jgi:hypothetical protein